MSTDRVYPPGIYEYLADNDRRRVIIYDGKSWWLQGWEVELRLSDDPDYSLTIAPSDIGELLWVDLSPGVWQPIDSAPKDGTHILGHANARCAVVYWVGGDEGHWSLSESGVSAETGKWWPTHWMPLPPPPAEQDAENTSGVS